MTIKNHIPHSLPGKIALIVLLFGALASLGLVFYQGRHNASILLRLLFATWVLSPFIGLIVANVMSKHWSAITQGILYYLMLFITMGSLLGYSGVLNFAKTKPAFVFLVIPLISWFLMAVVIPITESTYRRMRTKHNK